MRTLLKYRKKKRLSEASRKKCKIHVNAALKHEFCERIAMKKESSKKKKGILSKDCGKNGEFRQRFNGKTSKDEVKKHFYTLKKSVNRSKKNPHKFCKKISEEMKISSKNRGGNANFVKESQRL